MPEKKKLPRLAQIKLAFYTSFRLLQLTWSINPLLLVGNIITFSIPSILPFVNIYIYKLIIDYTVQAVMRGQTELQPIILLISLRFASFFIQELSFKFQDYLNRLLWLKVPITISELVLGKLSTLDIRYFEDSQFKELLKNVDETYRYRTLNYLDSLMYGIQSFVQLSIACIAIATVHWILILIIVLAAIIEFTYQLIKVDVDWGIWWGSSPDRVKLNYLSGILQDAQSIKEIKIFQLGSHFVAEVVRLQKKFFEATREAALKNLFISSGIGFFSSTVSIGVELFIISRTLLGQFTIGDIGFYSGVITNFQNGIGGLLRNLSRIFESSLYVASIFELLDSKPFILESKAAIKFKTTTAPKIEFKDVSFTYPTEKKPILKGFSLTINPGEKIAFVGENGAGKSTIVKLLARFYDVDSGEILINDINLKDLDLSSWHQNMGVLFQDFNRYQYTAKENIYFGDIRSDMNEQKIQKAAKSSGAESVIEKLTNKYDQVLGKTFETGIELSTGQWQKIALGRSFFRNAPILILDEPTAAIDAKAEAEIFESVEKLSKEKSVIIISHRFSTVRNADKIYVIENGQIIERGSHSQLMKEKGKYAQLFTLQAKGYQ
jgi:ATP-binding cassette, subfamily B, bacterial